MIIVWVLLQKLDPTALVVSQLVHEEPLYVRIGAQT
jgi:hypothetical protein